MTIKLHRLSCEKEHSFFIDFQFPSDLHEFTKMLRVLTCPVCQSKELNLHAGEFQAKQEIGGIE